jgi:hypothetical protein
MTELCPNGIITLTDGGWINVVVMFTWSTGQPRNTMTLSHPSPLAPDTMKAKPSHSTLVNYSLQVPTRT